MIAIGSDHGGFGLKQSIIEHLKKTGVEFEDVGVYSEETADYPIIAAKVADKVLSGECGKGVLICGTGIGVSIAANRRPGIRAALCSEPFSARLSREHNDANVLALGGRVLGAELAAAIVDAFLSTPFSNGERHKNRISMMK
jgi:ribose 5-phosphate isomerase B